uniref:Uncharacterized protein TCIL3000_3_3300 n=1 Tax=Trypanosoma congolense (strain IL3000) TaxID=1068625 RepID=G0UKJ1_TRYCI|nr:unnamed protein product [Trypanosoma congolense IL3000]
MDAPNYARTGLLSCAYAGLPVAEQRFASATSTKWFPSLLTVPQRLLWSITNEDGVDNTLLNFLSAAYTYEEIRKYHPDPSRHSELMRTMFNWYRKAIVDGMEKTITPGTFQPYLPAYCLCVLKEGKTVASYGDLSRRGVTLCGKDRDVNDIPLDHPSCSAQHAVLEVNFVYAHAEEFQKQFSAFIERMSHQSDWDSAHFVDEICSFAYELVRNLGKEEDSWPMELQVTDLGSTNGTRLNGELLRPLERVTLIEGDVLTFGCSTRSYVVVRA